MKKGFVLAAIAATLVAIGVASTASAQYPPPKGGLVCAIAKISSVTGGQAQISATLRSTTGTAISGELVVFEFVQRPSASTTLSNNSGVTDASGTAYTTLNVGNVPGRIVVKAYNDALECRVLLDVLEPVRQVEGIRPPTTGDAGLVGDSTNAFISLGFIVTMIALLFVGAAVTFALRAGNVIESVRRSRNE